MIFISTSLPLPKMMEKGRRREFGSIAQTKALGTLTFKTNVTAKVLLKCIESPAFLFQDPFCLCETSLLHMEGKCCQILIWRIKNLFFD